MFIQDEASYRSQGRQVMQQLPPLMVSGLGWAFQGQRRI